MTESAARNRRYRARKRGEDAPLLRRPWTAEDIEILKRAYADNIGIQSGFRGRLAEQLGRTPRLISKKAKSLGLAMGKRLLFSQAIKDQMSATQSLRHAFTEHPRGMLGKKHSADSRAAMSKARMFVPRGPYKPSAGRNIAEVSVARFRTKPESLHARRAKCGRREDIGTTYFRSAWEANYARLLTYQGVKWEYEVKTFWFEKIRRGTRSYTPDFYLPATDEYHEVKGWMDPRSLTKLKRMKKYHPTIKVTVIDKTFFNDAEKKKVCQLIPHWECSHNAAAKRD